MITECSMADNLRNRFPQVEFIKPCNLCPHMKRITLPNIHSALRDLGHGVHVPAQVAARARLALERILAVGARARVGPRRPLSSSCAAATWEQRAVGQGG